MILDDLSYLLSLQILAVKAAVRFAAGYRLEVGHCVIPRGLNM